MLSSKMIVKWAAVKDTVLKVHFTEQNFAEKLSPQAEEKVRKTSNKVARKSVTKIT